MTVEQLRTDLETHGIVLEKHDAEKCTFLVHGVVMGRAAVAQCSLATEHALGDDLDRTLLGIRGEAQDAFDWLERKTRGAQ